MDVTITPHRLEGSVTALSSKSMAHRLLILAALSQGITDFVCPSLSEDIGATLRCLKALGAPAMGTRDGLRMVPLTVGGVRHDARLDVGESGSTLRFLLPVAAALGQGATFVGHGRLAQRPLSPLDEQLEIHGVTLSERGRFPLAVSGTLEGGDFQLPGNVSSQFVSGLLMAAPLLADGARIAVSEPVESKGYIDLTVDALKAFGIHVDEHRETIDDHPVRVYQVPTGSRLVTPGLCTVEGDWSNAAFWLAAGALGPQPLSVTGLDLDSRQGDRAIMAALAMMGARMGRSSGIVAASREALHGRDVDVSGIPDLVPPLAAVASVAQGTTRLAHAGRLRLKESDRLQTVSAALCALGGRARIEGDDLVIEGVNALGGGTVDAANDHRIAMMASICAAYATGPTTILGADCVSKSYPSFFDDFRALGGIAREEEA